MKKLFILAVVFILLPSFTSQPEILEQDMAFKNGEYLKYRIHYLGITGGYATLNLKETNYNASQHIHAIGKGWTVGATKFFFKVDDNYETYIHKSTLQPSKFVRKINEGGYTKDKEIYFSHHSQTAKVKDNKNNFTKTYKTKSDIQDMLSAFYYLRSQDHTSLKTGSSVKVNIFMDEEVFPFQLKVLGRETVNTKFGKVKCIKIRPYVQSGRVFKAKESVTMWVTDDANMVPVLIKAELAVGSLKAALYEYKNTESAINFY